MKVALVFLTKWLNANNSVCDPLHSTAGEPPTKSKVGIHTAVKSMWHSKDSPRQRSAFCTDPSHGQEIALVSDGSLKQIAHAHNWWKQELLRFHFTVDTLVIR